MKQKRHPLRRRASDIPLCSLEDETHSKRNRLLATSLPPSTPPSLSDNIESKENRKQVLANLKATAAKITLPTHVDQTRSTTAAPKKKEQKCQSCKQGDRNSGGSEGLVICSSCQHGYHASCHPFPVDVKAKSNAQFLFFCHVCLPKAKHFEVDCACKVPIRLGDLIECDRCRKLSHVHCVGVSAALQPFTCFSCSEKCLFEEMDRLFDDASHKAPTAVEDTLTGTHDHDDVDQGILSCPPPPSSCCQKEYHKMSLQNLLLNDLSESHSDDICSFFEDQAMPEPLPPRRLTLLDAVAEIEVASFQSSSHLSSPRHEASVEALTLSDSRAGLHSSSPSPPPCHNLTAPLEICSRVFPETLIMDGFLVAARVDLGWLYTQFRVPDEVLIRAFDICKRLSERKMLKGPTTYAMTVSAFLIACRKEALPCTFAEIAKLAHVSKKDLGRLTKLILASLQETMEPVSTDSYVARYCYKLGLGREITELVLFVVHRACEQGDVDGRCPLSIIAAAIYCVSFIAPNIRKITKRDIAETVGIAEVTITNSFRLMLPNLPYLFPKEYSAIIPLDLQLV